MLKTRIARACSRDATVASLCLVLFASLVSDLAVQHARAETIVPELPEQVTPLAAGDPAPKFVVRTVDDTPFEFDPAALERPAVFITFRGGWCPYCNMHLSELRTVMPELAALDVDVIFLSGDRPELLYSSLKADTQQNIDGLGYRIYSDADAQAAMAFGIAFRTPAATLQRRQEQGDDIAGSSMDRHDVLPVPSVFVVGTDGTIRYAFVEPDYRVRLPAADLLAAVRQNVN